MCVRSALVLPLAIFRGKGRLDLAAQNCTAGPSDKVGMGRKRESHRCWGVNCVLCIEAEDVCMSNFGKSDIRKSGEEFCYRRTDLEQ